MELGTIGYNYSHDKDFVMDRPNGPGCWLMLLIKTPAAFTVNGKNINVKANSFIMFSPETPCKYRAEGDTYTDDWIYFGADETDRKYFEKLGIPVNEPVYLGDIEELSAIIHILSYEHYSASGYSLEIEKHYIEIFLLKLSRMIMTGTSISSRSFTERNHRMTQLRTTILTQPDKKMSIDEMAESMNMSRSRFQHLYKQMYGISVTKDITNGRMERAKRLLSSTDLTIEEIAVRCGYLTGYSFMHKFKAEIGKTPTEYRNCLGRESL